MLVVGFFFFGGGGFSGRGVGVVEFVFKFLSAAFWHGV